MSPQQNSDAEPTSPTSTRGSGEDRTRDMADFAGDGEGASAQGDQNNPQDFSSFGDMFNDPAEASSTSETNDDDKWHQDPTGSEREDPKSGEPAEPSVVLQTENQTPHGTAANDEAQKGS